MEINFIGGAYQGRSSNLNAQVCQNLYPVIDNQGGKSVLALYPTPGLREWCNPAYVGEVRGLHVMGDYLYAVIGLRVYRFTSAGVALRMTGDIGTTTGRVRMANNGTQLLIVDGAAGYILSGTTVTQITDTDFPIPSSCCYQDGYFFVTEAGTYNFYMSDSLDGTSWDGTNYEAAFVDPDPLQVMLSTYRELWLFGKTSFEVWGYTGETFPYALIEGSFSKIGCIAEDSPDELQGTIAWLDDQRAVRATEGYQAVRISTTQVEYQLAQYDTVSDAIGYFYTQEGHVFYVLTFPTEGKTWAYDFMTKMWHTRARANDDYRSRANVCILFGDKHIVGDYENGKLYYYDLDKYTENGEMMRRIRAAQAVHQDRKLLFHTRFEIEFEAGTGLVSGTGSDPMATLQWSDDGGHVWGNEHSVSIGKIGEYSQRAVWRRLGRSRDRIYKVTVADPVKTVIIGAHLEAASGRS
uniref:Putative capsid protein n=1 Tax=viral metagenome TaxID=1070528 RepID=A0A6M3IR80_9ZZZZ